MKIQTFRLIDQNFDGKIDKDELRNFLSSLNLQNDLKVEDVLSDVGDNNENNTPTALNQSNFLLNFNSKLKNFNNLNELKQSFECFDLDLNGFININDFHRNTEESVEFDKNFIDNNNNFHYLNWLNTLY